MLHALRVVGAHLGAGILQRGDDGDGRGLAHIVGVGLERQPEHRDRASPDAAAADGDDLRAIARLRWSLMEMMVSIERIGTPKSSPALSSASRSLGKQDPP